MFGQLLSAKRREGIPAAWRTRGWKLSWKRPYDPRIPKVPKRAGRHLCKAWSQRGVGGRCFRPIFIPGFWGLVRPDPEWHFNSAAKWVVRSSEGLNSNWLVVLFHQRWKQEEWHFFLKTSKAAGGWFQASFNHVLKGGVPDAGTEGMRTVLCKQTTKVYSWKSKKIHQPRKSPAFKAIDIPTTTWSSNLLGETVLCR